MRALVLTLIALGAAGALAACGGGGANGTATEPDPRADRQAIVAALDAWPGAWERRDADAVCDLFAPDVVFSFQGGRDRDLAEACAQFRALLRSDKTVSYAPPEIESLVVDGDLAAVRVIWTSTIAGADGKVLERSREKGLDVFERQDDGAWRIAVSYAYPLD